jgi:hypothetical protein
LRPQVGLALLQLLYDLVAFHGHHYTAKRVKNTFSCTGLSLAPDADEGFLCARATSP